MPEIDLEELHDRLVKLGEEWAELKHAGDLLAETKKSVLAQLTLDCMMEAKNKTEAELMALASQTYRDHVRLAADMAGKANLAKVKYDAARTWCDMLRTQEATRRAEMKL